MNPDEVVRDCRAYSDTVAFFYVVYQALRAAGISVEVEQQRRTTGSSRACPDFLISSSGRITDVLEHKASLTDSSHTALELNEVTEKYSRFEDESGTAEPRVTLLYPARQERVIRDLPKTVDARLNLCAFDQTTSDTAISFDLRGGVVCRELDALLRGAPIVYDPAIVRSTVKFIRASPPVPYTAFEVWGLFPSFRNVKEADQRTHEVSRAALLDRLKVFYPPWIRDNLQVNSARVDSALTFLAAARFIEWQPGSDRIRVDSRKGTRSGDLLEAFAQAYARISSRPGKLSGRQPPRGQRTLDDFNRG